jgi:anti-sigma B factor antagonist
VARAGDLEVTLSPLESGGALVSAVGELDLATVAELETTLERVDLGDRIVLDLAGVTFLDSSALRVLLATIRGAEEAGGTVELVAPEPGVARVLEIAAIDTMVAVHGSLGDAGIDR